MYITVIHYIDYTTLIMFILHYQTVVRYGYPPFLGAIKLYEHMGHKLNCFSTYCLPVSFWGVPFFAPQAP